MSKDSTIIRLNIAKDRLNAIKVARTLALSANTTFVAVSNNAAEDLVGLFTSDRDDAVEVTKFVPDTTRPTLVGFSVNMNGANVTLTFSEAVDSSTFNISHLHFQNNATATEDLFLLTEFARVTGDGAELTFVFTATDLNRLNALPYCTGVNDCYLVYTTDLVSDMVALPLNPLVNATAVKVTDFVVDRLAPTLVSFEVLNFNDGTFTLIFRNSSSVDFRSISCPNQRMVQR